jgi:uncharacterized membrane protein YdjX (TVP38/TMEM64 family)
MKHVHRFVGYIVLIVFILLVGAVAFAFPGVLTLGSVAEIRQFLLGFGTFGYGMFVLLLMLSIPLPIPSTPVILAGGYLYGVVAGTGLALVANIIGASLSFYLVRHFGTPLLEKLVDKKHIIHFNHIMKKRGKIAVLISYVVPLFPSDAVGLMLGLSKIKYRHFIGLLILGHIPRYLIINSLGQDLFSGFTLRTIIVLLFAATLLLVAIFRKWLKRKFFKELHAVEREIERI